MHPTREYNLCGLYFSPGDKLYEIFPSVLHLFFKYVNRAVNGMLNIANFAKVLTIKSCHFVLKTFQKAVKLGVPKRG